MPSADKQSACSGCGALVSAADGPTHRYIGATAGCWSVYVEVLAREYSDARYGQLHQLTVDTYAVQHPGTPSPQSIQSVTVHLVGLYLVFGLGQAPHRVTQSIQRLTVHKKEFVWLEPPSSMGPVTILDVLAAPDAVEHLRRVRQWGESVWRAWESHHPTARRYAEQWLAV